MTRSQLIDRVIDLATRIGEYWDAELPRRHPRYPLIRAGEDSGPPPPEEGALRELLRSRPVEDVYFLAALMYLGIGDFNPPGIGPEMDQMRRTFGDPDRAITQMLSKGALAAHLTDGYQALRDAGIDPDAVRPQLAA